MVTNAIKGSSMNCCVGQMTSVTHARHDSNSVMTDWLAELTTIRLR